MCMRACGWVGGWEGGVALQVLSAAVQSLVASCSGGAVFKWEADSASGSRGSSMAASSHGSAASDTTATVGFRPYRAGGQKRSPSALAPDSSGVFPPCTPRPSMRARAIRSARACRHACVSTTPPASGAESKMWPAARSINHAVTPKDDVQVCHPAAGRYVT